jgi:hypothetical protein
LLSQVAKLAMHIAENPLPQRLLRTVPSRLNSSHLPSGVIVVSGASAKSWWDTQDTTAGPLTNELCRLALLGTDMLRYCLLLIKGSTAEASLDEFILSRALCRCTYAAIVSLSLPLSKPDHRLTIFLLFGIENRNQYSIITGRKGRR